METNDNGSHDNWSPVNGQLRSKASEHRHRSEQLADQLSREAIQQLQKSVEGVLSIPTAVALGIASSTLYVAALFERGFEAVQITTEALRSGLEKGRIELSQAETDDRRLRGGNEARA